MPVALGRVPNGATDTAIACTLSAEQVEDRLEEWRTVLAQVEHREPIDGHGLRLALPPDASLDEVARLVQAEQGCCSFFAFALTVDRRGAALEVRAPAEAAELVATLFGEPGPTDRSG